jgi:hypothetical protein
MLHLTLPDNAARAVALNAGERSTRIASPGGRSQATPEEPVIGRDGSRPPVPRESTPHGIGSPNADAHFTITSIAGTGAADRATGNGRPWTGVRSIIEPDTAEAARAVMNGRSVRLRSASPTRRTHSAVGCAAFREPSE